MPRATKSTMVAQGRSDEPIDNVVPFPSAVARRGQSRRLADNAGDRMDYVKSAASNDLANDVNPNRARPRGTTARKPVKPARRRPQKSTTSSSPTLPASGLRRCDPLVGGIVETTHELARELCRVRWALHCALGKLERVEQDHALLASKVEALRARDASLVAELAQVAPNDLALADATSMHWRCSPLGRYADRERTAEAAVFAALEQLGVAVKDGDR
jgi:hypothetical protein